MCSRLVILLAAGAVSTSVACSHSATGPSTLPTGVWGGDHVSLTVKDGASHAEFDCAHGDVPSPWVVDAGHAFTLAGTFVREHGGPIRVDEVADAHPATYFGTLAADTMVLTITLNDTKDVIGTFTLIRGTTGRAVKCL